MYTGRYWVKILFNTRFPAAAASLFYLAGFKKSKDFLIDTARYDDADDYDVVFFMSYLDDLKDLQVFRRKYPKKPVGVIDPRGTDVIPFLSGIDFFIIDSIEMEDFWTFSGKPALRYVEYPDIPKTKKIHENKDVIAIGYHGNLVHLESAEKTVLSALSDLSREYNIELNLMYNLEVLGKWEHPLGKAVKINHIQWSMNNYTEFLANSDIGIAPNLLPTDINGHKSSSGFFKKFFKGKETRNYNYREDDYLLRFKASSNPGRIIVFGRLGIPVVSDFYPSAFELISHGSNGFLANSKDAWFSSIKELIKSRELRQEIAENMLKSVNKYEFDLQNDKLLCNLNEIIERK